MKVEDLGGGWLVAHVDRLRRRPLRRGVRGQATGDVASTRRPERRWRDLA